MDLVIRFFVIESDGKLLLKFDNGKYLFRIDCGRISKIEVVKDILDDVCYFIVYN